VLKNINPLISPDLLYQLYIMGHGDEIIFADAHFPGHSLNKNVIRCDGLKIPDLLEAILPLLEILECFCFKPRLQNSTQPTT
jgi:L-fucose mutarotase